MSYFSDRFSGWKVDPTVTLDASTPYGCKTGDVNAAYLTGRWFTLKQAPLSGSVTYAAMRTSANYATIDSMLIDYNGRSKDAYTSWWDVPGNNATPVNNRAGTGFVEYTSRPNVNPPRLWYNEGRLRWMDETDEQSAVGNWGAKANAKGNMYSNAVIGNFNVRAENIHRSPFCYNAGWTSYTPGPVMLPWAAPQLGDSRAALPFYNSKAHGSPFGLPSDLSAPKSYAMFDVPVTGMPVFSLAQFQHAQLGFQGWQPTYIIGNSIAEPRSDRDKTVQATFYAAGGAAWSKALGSNSDTGGNWDDLVQGSASAETLCYDVSYMTNEMLFDRYFLSTVPYSTDGSGQVTWNTASELPNSRLVLQTNQGLTDTAIKGYFSTTKPFDYASYFLMNKGAFNINSTSVEAWRAFFSTLNRVPRPDAGSGSAVNTFARLMYPQSGTQPSGTRSLGAWAGERTLTDSEIQTLANNMVALVKTRGPFLGLSDFVNRRLGAATTSTYDDETFCGPLQAAIEKSGLNSTLQTTADATSYDIGGAFTGSGCYMPDVKAYYNWKTFGAPGYLTQADMLQTLAPNMTARGDTFIVRGYGDARDSTGKIILARAWCEATVQRTADYLVSATISGKAGTPTGSNNPIDPITIRNPASFALVANSTLQTVNKTFGRRMNVVDFRWLSAGEI